MTGQKNGHSKLKKELKLPHVMAIATGTTLSAGFFLLPGIAAEQAGPAIVLSYLLAAVPLIPAMFSIIELATAMPRAGGVYYFLDRTLGPVFGTIGGIGTWLALILKVSFALVGMGAYIRLFIPDLPIIPVAILLAVALGALNIFGAKKSGRFQVFLVIGLLIILLIFFGKGIPDIHYIRFDGFFDAGFNSIISTAGLVYISYVGITNIASLSEEVKDPEKNLPMGVILSLAAAFIIYGVGTAIMVGVLPMESLKGSLTPVAAAADMIFGEAGAIMISVGAMLAFISVANAGTMSASRYPLAMSRDHILPGIFTKLSNFGSPYISIITTVGVIVLILLLLDPTGIAKLASAFQLLMFAFVCLAVIVIRESRIESYDPGYKSPFYPWMQIIGILTSFWFIIQMGWMPSIFSLGLTTIGTAWYFYYAKDKVYRNGAIYHIFERLGRSRYGGLDIELRGILKEKGLRDTDPFDEIVARSLVIDNPEVSNFEVISSQVSEWLSNFLPGSSEDINKQFMEGTRIGATPVTHGIALPHFRCKGINQAEMVLVRSTGGVYINYKNPIKDFQDETVKVHGLFFVVSPEDNPAQHLRILAQLAGRLDEDSFYKDWFNAENEQNLKEALLREDRFFALKIKSGKKSEELIGLQCRQINFPEGCLIALLRRGPYTIVPKGNVVFEEGDRLTVLGDSGSLNELRKIYS